ncbi:MAG: hypothetical protein IIA82_11090 [Thaumarchaeota archaeon]|nr:hypothetical protein [Nitrososphaerota archaeon]
MSQTTMKTNTGTLNRLRNHGKCGDSLDNVLNKVLDSIEDKIEDLSERVSNVEEDLDTEDEPIEAED